MDLTQLTEIPAPKDTMIVGRGDGRLYVVDFTECPQLTTATDIDWSLSVSKIIVGKLQQNRSRWITLEELEFENIAQTDQNMPGALSDVEITLYGTQDGKNVNNITFPVIVTREGSYIHAKCRMTAKNFQVGLCGTYNINTIVFTYHNHGKR